MTRAAGMLIAYDAAGNVLATLDQRVVYDAEGTPIGLVDFIAHEESGREHTEIWFVSQEHDGVDIGSVKGSKAWPEWLGSRVHEFRVELDGPAGGKRIGALVHKSSGHRRERDPLDRAIASRRADGGVVDLREVVGGPQRPLSLDVQGRTRRTFPVRPDFTLVSRSR